MVDFRICRLSKSEYTGIMTVSMETVLKGKETSQRSDLPQDHLAI